MKIKIDSFEKYLPYKIKRNFSVIGCDLAAVSGIAFLKTDNEYLYTDYMVLGFKTKDHKEIYHTMVKTFYNLIKDVNLVVIEGVFSGISIGGSLELAKSSAFAIAVCILKDYAYEIIGPSTARAKFKIDVNKFGKGKCKEAVAWWLEQNLGLKFTDNNISDATLLALCGLCEGFDYRSMAKIEKEEKKKIFGKKK